MTFGKQFENTFWVDPNTGDTHAWVRENDSEGIPRNSPRHLINPEQSPAKPLQGLLFHPLTGTGMQGDPVTPESTRQGVIKRLFGFVSPEQYKENLGKIVSSQKVVHIDYHKDEAGNPVIESVPASKRISNPYKNPEGNFTEVRDPNNPRNVLRQAYTQRTTAKISDRQAQKHMDWITEAASETDIPTHVLERRADNPMNVVLDPSPGRAYIEGGGKNIRLTYPKGGTSKISYTNVEIPAASETPVHNPKFWKELASVDRGDSHEDITAEEVLRTTTHWIHPPTGHVITAGSDELKELLGSDEKSHLEALNALEHLGYFPNLFKGSGTKLPEKHALGKVHDIETGYAWTKNRDYYYDKFHTRFTPDASQPNRVVREKTVTRAAPNLNKSTIIHEVGHALDPSLGDKYNNQYLLNTYADPLKEGIADAAADRYVRYKGLYEDILANSPQRLNQFKVSGYTTRYSGWKNKVHKALYIGSRYHAALSDDNAETLPSREQLANVTEPHIKQLIDAAPLDKKSKVRSDFLNTMALGQMYDKFSHIHGILRQAGLEEVAQKAHGEYLKHTRGSATQPMLPGMEKFA